MSIVRAPSSDPEAVKARENFERAKEALSVEGLKSLGSVRKVQNAYEEMMEVEKLAHARDWEKEKAKRKKARCPHMGTPTVLVILAAVGCLLALFDMPDDFYKVLRFVVVAACVSVIWTVQKSGASEKKKTVASVLFGLLAVVFNPILPLEMERKTWAWFDIATAGVMLFEIFPIWSKIKSVFDDLSEKGV